MTVVTPSYNQGLYIEETIRSILLQGYPDLEYMIFDGGSTDGTATIIRRYAPWLTHWVSERDGGQTAAINAGWHRATGEILAYLNSDDAYLPGALANAARAFSDRPGAGMVYGSALVVDEQGRMIRVWEARPFALRTMLIKGNLVPQPSSFYSRRALREAGYLAEQWQMIMDYELSIRVGLRFPSVCLPVVLARFRDHPASKSQTRFPSMAQELIRFVTVLDAERAVKKAALSRIHYEWASSALVPGRRDGGLAIRHLCRSLRLHPLRALQHAPQTAYLMKEVILAFLHPHP